MKDTIAEKLLVDPLVDGELEPESEVGLKIDQVLTRDATGMMVYLEFGAMGVPMAKASAAVNCDQSIIQTDSRNMTTAFSNFMPPSWALRSLRQEMGSPYHVHRHRLGLGNASVNFFLLEVF